MCWPCDMVNTIYLQAILNSVGPVRRGRVIIHEQKVIVDFSTEKTTMKLEQPVELQQCTVLQSWSLFQAHVVECDHWPRCCLYHDATITILIPSLDISERRALPTSRHTCSRLLSEERLNRLSPGKRTVVCLYSRPRSNGDADGTIVNGRYGDSSQVGHTKHVFGRIVLSVANTLQQFSGISEFLRLHKIYMPCGFVFSPHTLKRKLSSQSGHPLICSTTIIIFC